MALGAGLGAGGTALLQQDLHPKHPWIDVAGGAIGGAGVAAAMTNEERAFELGETVKKLQQQMAQRPVIK